MQFQVKNLISFRFGALAAIVGSLHPSLAVVNLDSAYPWVALAGVVIALYATLTDSGAAAKP